MSSNAPNFISHSNYNVQVIHISTSLIFEMKMGLSSNRSGLRLIFKDTKIN